MTRRPWREEVKASLELTQPPPQLLPSGGGETYTHTHSFWLETRLFSSRLGLILRWLTRFRTNKGHGGHGARNHRGQEATSIFQSASSLPTKDLVSTQIQFLPCCIVCIWTKVGVRLLWSPPRRFTPPPLLGNKSDSVLTQQRAQPDGQVLLHGHQRGLVSHRQPLVVLEDVGEAGSVPLAQQAAGAPGAQQGGIELLAVPNLKRKESNKKEKSSEKHWCRCEPTETRPPQSLCLEAAADVASHPSTPPPHHHHYGGVSEVRLKETNACLTQIQEHSSDQSSGVLLSEG